MNRKKERGLALVLGLALLMLSGCDGTQSGTIDYIDGHWVFTDGQTAQSADVTQLFSDPDAFYGAASAMTDAELQQSFDRLSSVQCAEIFRGLGEERAMALAGRLTQTQVDRLLTILQGQENVRELTDAASLASVWYTLTTDEQLSALSALSAEEYAALWSLLGGGETASSEPEITPEPTAAPDMMDPAYLAGIWHTLNGEEQSTILGKLTSAQFVTLWGLINEQATSVPAQESTEPVFAAQQDSDVPAGETGAVQTEAVQTDAPKTDAPQTAQTTPTPETTEEDVPKGTPNPAAMAEAWYAMTPEEQLGLMKVLTTDEFVVLQELLAEHPKPTPGEEDEMFIPTPKPTPTPTPVPTAAPEAPEQEPDWNDPVYLASIWHTLSPEEQLSILANLTLEQYVELQALLARLTGAQETPQEPDAVDDAGAPAEENGASAEETETPKETEAPKPTETPKRTEKPKETEKPEETETPKPTETPAADTAQNGTDDEQTPGEATDPPVSSSAGGTLETAVPEDGSLTPDSAMGTLSDAILRVRDEIETPDLTNDLSVPELTENLPVSELTDNLSVPELPIGEMPVIEEDPLVLLSRMLNSATGNGEAETGD